MSKTKFTAPVMERDAFLTLLNDTPISSEGSGLKQDRELPTLLGVNKLWRSVIAQAFIDGLSNSRKAQLKREKQRAISWLLGRSEEFFTVCSLADTDPELVYQRAKKLFERETIELDISKSPLQIETKTWLPQTDIAIFWTHYSPPKNRLVAA